MRNTQYCAASRTPDGMLPLVIEGGPSTYHRSCRCPGVPDPCLLAQGSQCNGEVLFDGLHGNSAETGRLALAQAIDPHQHEHLPATRRQRQDGIAQPRLLLRLLEVGSASCRERGCQYVLIWVVAVYLK